ncbi:hypothetical protein M885DRAFT_623199 [Pelagophyceae sp. CCMP2097]|nr:hypothetical protein M885DRAFT_623199 [Pelagophyceae sp. CCMP2097]
MEDLWASMADSDDSDDQAALECRPVSTGGIVGVGSLSLSADDDARLIAVATTSQVKSAEKAAPSLWRRLTREQERLEGDAFLRAMGAHLRRHFLFTCGIKAKSANIIDKAELKRKDVIRMRNAERPESLSGRGLAVWKGHYVWLTQAGIDYVKALPAAPHAAPVASAPAAHVHAPPGAPSNAPPPDVPRERNISAHSPEDDAGLGEDDGGSNIVPAAPSPPAPAFAAQALAASASPPTPRRATDGIPRKRPRQDTSRTEDGAPLDEGGGSTLEAPGPAAAATLESDAEAKRAKKRVKQSERRRKKRLAKRQGLREAPALDDAAGGAEAACEAAAEAACKAAAEAACEPVVEAAVGTAVEPAAATLDEGESADKGDAAAAAATEPPEPAAYAAHDGKGEDEAAAVDEAARGEAQAPLRSAEAHPRRPGRRRRGRRGLRAEKADSGGGGGGGFSEPQWVEGALGCLGCPDDAVEGELGPVLRIDDGRAVKERPRHNTSAEEGATPGEESRSTLEPPEPAAAAAPEPAAAAALEAAERGVKRPRPHGAVKGPLAPARGEDDFVARCSPKRPSGVGGGIQCQKSSCSRPIAMGEASLGRRLACDPQTKWYHVECIFATFEFCVRRGTKTITDTAEIKNFSAFAEADRARIQGCVARHVVWLNSRHADALARSRSHGGAAGSPAAPRAEARFLARHSASRIATCSNRLCRKSIGVADAALRRLPTGTAKPASVVWFHVECIFESFDRVHAGTQIITDTADVEDLDKFSEADQARVRDCIAWRTAKPLSKTCFAADRDALELPRQSNSSTDDAALEPPEPAKTPPSSSLASEAVADTALEPAAEPPDEAALEPADQTVEATVEATVEPEADCGEAPAPLEPDATLESTAAALEREPAAEATIEPAAGAALEPAEQAVEATVEPEAADATLEPVAEPPDEATVEPPDEATVKATVEPEAAAGAAPAPLEPAAERVDRDDAPRDAAPADGDEDALRGTASADVAALTLAGRCAALLEAMRGAPSDAVSLFQGAPEDLRGDVETALVAERIDRDCLQYATRLCFVRVLIAQALEIEADCERLIASGATAPPSARVSCP